MHNNLTKPEAEAALDPILALIQQCIEEAWSEWENFYAPKHHILDARARASIVYCHIVDRALVLFQGVDGVVPGRKRGVFRLFVGEDLALRFKKAKSDGTTSNISTKQQQLIDLQWAIPGILPGTMLNATYQLDDLQRTIRKLMITHQLDGRVQWSIALKGDSQEPIEMPSQNHSTAHQKPRARLKGQQKKRKSQDLN
jgi:hypothetical protein